MIHQSYSWVFTGEKKKNMKMKALIQKELMHPNAHAPQCS